MIFVSPDSMIIVIYNKPICMDDEDFVTRPNVFDRLRLLLQLFASNFSATVVGNVRRFIEIHTSQTRYHHKQDSSIAHVDVWTI